ncbi:uncharacterized protein BKA78DRAFT_295254 [Phyllosticta capitalensis]|uniref:uncharacterized protein n=1 Tax=Phyllosticta capitalensis TaxID=121624 RepID=UPI00312D1F8B
MAVNGRLSVSVTFARSSASHSPLPIGIVSLELGSIVTLVALVAIVAVLDRPRDDDDGPNHKAGEDKEPENQQGRGPLAEAAAGVAVPELRLFLLLLLDTERILRRRGLRRETGGGAVAGVGARRRGGRVEGRQLDALVVGGGSGAGRGLLADMSSAIDLVESLQELEVVDLPWWCLCSRWSWRGFGRRALWESCSGGCASAQLLSITAIGQEILTQLAMRLLACRETCRVVLVARWLLWVGVVRIANGTACWRGAEGAARGLPNGPVPHWLSRTTKRLHSRLKVHLFQFRIVAHVIIQDANFWKYLAVSPV